MEMGELGILNIGAGHDKLVFDPKDPEANKKAAKVLKDMMRAGYSILIEIDDGQGGKTTQRVKGFQEDTFEYIISAEKKRRGRKPGSTSAGTRRVPATGTRGVAVHRTSGG